MTHDKNLNAKDRLVNDYNNYWVPTLYWDGGNIVTVGDPNSYSSNIDQCKVRPVADVDAALDVAWRGNATMDISVTVRNNGTAGYDGTIKVYVCELVSSMGWNDSSGNPYHFPFLDWAVKDTIRISGGNTWRTDTTWDGALHSDGFGNDFGGITFDNTIVFVALFDSTSHPAYSDPPGGRPFDAFWLDECVAARPAIHIDNADPMFISNGGWSTASHPKAVGGTVDFTAPGGQKWAGWRADTEVVPGSYDVYLWKFSSSMSPNLASNAPYRVYHKNGISSWIEVDWTTPVDEWVPLGTYEFDGSSPQGVMLTNAASSFVVADTIKFVPSE